MRINNTFNEAGNMGIFMTSATSMDGRLRWTAGMDGIELGEFCAERAHFVAGHTHTIQSNRAATLPWRRARALALRHQTGRLEKAFGPDT